MIKKLMLLFSLDFFQDIVVKMTDHDYAKRPYFSEIKKYLNFDEILKDPVLNTDHFDVFYFYIKLNITFPQKAIKEFYSLGFYSETLKLCAVQWNTSLNLNFYVWLKMKEYKILLKIRNNLHLITEIKSFVNNQLKDRKEVKSLQYLAFFMLNTKDSLELAIKSIQLAIKNKENDKDLAKSYQMAASIFIKKGDLKNAHIYNEKAIELKERLKKNIFKENLNYCSIYVNEGNFEKALKFNKLAFKFKKENYGEKHFDNSFCMNNFTRI